MSAALALLLLIKFERKMARVSRDVSTDLRGPRRFSRRRLCGFALGFTALIGRGFARWRSAR